MIDFTDLLILMVVIWTAGKVFRKFKLPIIFGELIGGVIVGPMLLNIVHADSELIKIIAEFGIFFLMLHSGLESNPDELLSSSKKSVLIALGGALLPFLGGYYTTLAFGYPAATAFFVGMGISISAIAISARLFKDYNMLNSKVAHMSLGAAIIDDILALILFSVAINVAETGHIELIPLLVLLAKVIAFFTVVIYGGNKIAPFMNRIIYFKNKGFTLTLIIALLMGLIAEAIGLHMIIGAFLAGLFIREEVIDKRVFDKIEDRIYGLSYGFFGPVFFASLAFHLDFSAITSAPLFLTAIIVVAILGKVIGSGGPARLLKLSNTESLAIGVSMNSRGAVELIIASIGLSMGIIDQKIFSILILMAFFTTVFSIVTMHPIAIKLKKENQTG
jgi:Kef-type K+ transport system membrane component KefB